MWFLNHFTMSFITGPKWTSGISIKKLSKGLRWTPKSSTRICIFHCPKLDDIVQKELCHHQPRWGCWMWWLEGKLGVDIWQEFHKLRVWGEYTSHHAPPKSSILACKMVSKSQSWHSSLGYEGGGRDMVPPLSSGPEEKDDANMWLEWIWSRFGGCWRCVVAVLDW